jgi:hypothetical protein
MESGETMPSFRWPRTVAGLRLPARAAGLLVCLWTGLLPAPAWSAFITTHEGALDAIYGQGALDIDIRLNASTSIEAAALLDIVSAADLSSLFGLAPAASPTVNLFFVDSVDFCGASFDIGIIGCANSPGNQIVLESVWAAGGLGAELTAHELGHSLGLGHVDDIANLMNPVLMGGTQLTPSQMATVVASPLVQSDLFGDFVSITPILVTPEPATWALVGAGLLALAWRRRRA